jgi:hypothetical protein
VVILKHDRGNSPSCTLYPLNDSFHLVPMLNIHGALHLLLLYIFLVWYLYIGTTLRLVFLSRFNAGIYIEIGHDHRRSEPSSTIIPTYITSPVEAAWLNNLESGLFSQLLNENMNISLAKFYVLACDSKIYLKYRNTLRHTDFIVCGFR